MKKIIYLFLALLIVACSSGGDDSSNCDYTDISFFEGTWVSDGELQADIFPHTITFNNEGDADCEYLDFVGKFCLSSGEYVNGYYVFELMETQVQYPIILYFEYINCNQIEARLNTGAIPYILNRE